MRQQHIDFIEMSGATILDIEIREGRDEALAYIVEKDGVSYRCSTSSLDRKVLPWISKRKAPKKYIYGDNFYIYRMFDSEGTLLYVGKTKQLDYRLYAHFCKDKQSWKDTVEKIDACKFDNEADMHIYEMYLIAKYKPVFNKHAACAATPTVLLPALVFEELTDWD